MVSLQVCCLEGQWDGVWDMAGATDTIITASDGEVGGRMEALGMVTLEAVVVVAVVVDVVVAMMVEGMVAVVVEVDVVEDVVVVVVN